MKDKCTHSVQSTQHLIAGLLQNDNSMEFYGLPETMEVQYIQNGVSHSFRDLPKDVFCILANAFNSNPEAKKHIGAITNIDGTALTFKKRVELYTYFMYGGCDATPDLVGEDLQETENYRHSPDCISLKFKKIKLNGCPLKEREVKMIDLMAQDHKDEVIALHMGIAQSTYNQHKKELFNKTGIQTKPGLMLAAMRQRITRFYSPAV